MRALIGTRKGLFRVEDRRDGWHVTGPDFLGVGVVNALRDPGDGSLWALLDHGHWGPKLQRSGDDGKTWEERACPKFPDGYEHDAIGEFGPMKGPASVSALMTMVPAGAPGAYHAGTKPGGLFTTRDAGETWTVNDALWTRRNKDNWFEGGGGIMLHSILVTPGRPERVFIGVSCGGAYETTDGGATWTPRNKGVLVTFLPDNYPEVGQDPHRLLQHPKDPEQLWQQNHCGVFRTTDGGRSWTDAMPDLPIDIGFALALDADDPRRAWTIPMDSDERRVAREGALAVCRTDDGGATWRELREGLPQRHCYDIVFRHAFDARDKTLLFGTTCGRLFASRDRGDTWRMLDAYLPPVNAVVFE